MVNSPKGRPGVVGGSRRCPKTPNQATLLAASTTNHAGTSSADAVPQAPGRKALAWPIGIYTNMPALLVVLALLLLSGRREFLHASSSLSSDPRLRSRYEKLVNSHLQATQALASGIHSLPDTKMSFAATQAAFRFFKNERLTLRQRVRPLIKAGRQEAQSACDRYLLVVHDWSQLMYPGHTSKRDRVMLSSKHEPEGYELQTALLVSDREGSPLTPVAIGLRAGDGVHCSRLGGVRPAESPLDEILPVMGFLEKQKLGFPLVHILDAEADSVDHYRQWSASPERYFLVRADDRIVEYESTEIRCSAVHQRLRDRDAFRLTREVQHHGQSASQWVAEAPVRRLRPAQRNRPGRGDRRRIPGRPLPLRLIISEIRDAEGRVLATWYLLTNVPSDVDASTLALWYYFRWRIESYFKLRKTAGMNVESWQQTSAEAIARRLLVASMACVTVWRLARSEHPEATPARRLLVRLSGRQMKKGCEFTMPSQLAGLWTLLAILQVLETHSFEQLQALAAAVFPIDPLGQPP